MHAKATSLLLGRVQSTQYLLVLLLIHKCQKGQNVSAIWDTLIRLYQL